MSLLKRITDEMYLSMKSGDKEKSITLRTLISKIKDQQIKLRKDISDEETIKIIKTLVKQRKESAEIYSKAGREELADKESFEVRILNNYLPKSMSDEEILLLIKKIIDETNSKDLSDIGRVMPLVMQRGKGKVDGKKANILLRSLLE
tara:strand:+ start:997 stop:1440 length:444 start_codon:yes stop_codon:yes gene_type:complete